MSEGSIFLPTAVSTLRPIMVYSVSLRATLCLFGAMILPFSTAGHSGQSKEKRGERTDVTLWVS
jgi:hypothetical protein